MSNKKHPTVTPALTIFKSLQVFKSVKNLLTLSASTSMSMRNTPQHASRKVFAVNMKPVRDPVVQSAITAVLPYPATSLMRDSFTVKNMDFFTFDIWRR